MSIEVVLKKLAVTKDGLSVFNPSNGELIATVSDHSPEEVEACITQLSDGLEEWSNTTAKSRGRLMLKWHALISKNKDTLARIMSLETGKPLTESLGEIQYGNAFIEWFAEEGKRAYGATISPHAQGKQALTIKQAVGVVAAITPWNFPAAMITRKVAPALAAGCTIIVKPAEATPLTALYLEVLAREAGIPDNVLKVVPTSNAKAIGEVMCKSSSIRKFSFTGSTNVGKILIKQCADTVKRVSMELGGNAPFIVFEDANLDEAVAGAMAAKFRNNGQACIAANRFFVHEDICDAFVRKLIDQVKKLKVGNGLDEGITIGPLINKAGLEKVSSLVKQAIAAGAKVEFGGEPHGLGGNFYQPTILTNVSSDMDISRNEIFGPVVAIQTFKNESDVIQRANDTEHGLSAYFYSENIKRVWRVMRALEAGMVGVNDGAISTEVAPFGGVKASGFGREGAKEGLDEYLETKYVSLGGV